MRSRGNGLRGIVAFALGGAAVAAGSALACDSLGGLSGADDEVPADAAADSSASNDSAAADVAALDAGTDASVVLGAAYRAEVLADGPLGYWRFEDLPDAKQAVDETGANHGTYPLEPAFVADGIAGSRALHIAKGSLSHVRVPGAAFGFPEKAAMAIEAWVRPSVYTDYEMLASSEPDVSPRRGWSLFLRTPGRAELDWWQGPPDASTDALAKFGATFVAADGGGVLATGAWIHVVFEYNGMGTRFYVDGEFRHNESTSFSSAASGSDVILGCRASSSGVKECLVDGDLDEVAIYDHPLGDVRVKAHYLKGKP